MINGIQFRDMIVSAANNIDNCKNTINDLNVFPVPDGDTGTNMSLTIQAAKKDIMGLNETCIGIVSEKCASALLKGARGNSGVILSLLFRGISKELSGLEQADVDDIVRGFSAGVKAAYSAVMKPTEGTMLTVARVASEKIAEFAKTNRDIKGIFELLVNVAAETLAQTPEMLPVLKQANVVDAGGKGILTIYEGMLHTLKTGEIIQSQDQTATGNSTSPKADFTLLENGDIKYKYCTEFIVEKNKTANFEGLRDFLYSIGDSVVAVNDDEIIKIHVHTNDPGDVIARGTFMGNLINIKIENMKMQHSNLYEKDQEMKEVAAATDEPIKTEPTEEFGFVAVASGDGLAEILSDLGVNEIIRGGQTMNPSTEAIIYAINKVPAKTVFVLPNNKNIIMAATQASELISDRQVLVIPSKTIPQGITAMLDFVPDASVEDNLANMTAALEKVKTGAITFAARDSVFDDREIKEGEYLGLVDNKIITVSGNLDDCAAEVIKGIIEGGKSLITIFYGCDVSEEDAQKMEKSVRGLTDCDISLAPGDQPIYYYIFAAE